ncbi:unnamed protein product [Staurois parvus]|uniref:Uncharacterized protein n=1 Tax=Staurois parvus TaxID=386267 RepID=A0ABN9CDH5_9NEOB|nr:unnamed protein product [Staurois parvus]
MAAQLLHWPQTCIFLCPFFLPSASSPLSWRIIHDRVLTFAAPRRP